MSAEENKAIARRVVEEHISTGDVEGARSIMAADVVDHNAPPGTSGVGFDEFVQAISELRSAFPDFNGTIEDIVAEGDKVAMRWVMRGTHQGSLFGMPATGKQVEVGVMDILRIENGKIVERWGQVDNMGMMQQLGVMPAPGQ